MYQGGADVTAAGNLKRTKISNIYGWIKCS